MGARIWVALIFALVLMIVGIVLLVMLKQSQSKILKGDATTDAYKTRLNWGLAGASASLVLGALMVLVTGFKARRQPQYNPWAMR